MAKSGPVERVIMESGSTAGRLTRRPRPDTPRLRRGPSARTRQAAGDYSAGIEALGARAKLDDDRHVVGDQKKGLAGGLMAANETCHDFLHHRMDCGERLVGQSALWG